MKIFNSLENIKIEDYTAIALGAFDGLHLGHKSVINKVFEKNLSASVFTFKENPSKNLTGKTNYILTQEEKLDILDKWGAKNCFCPDFNLLQNMEAEDFVVKILFDKCKAKVLSCGKDFRFGKKALGDVALLQKLCNENGVCLQVAGDFCVHDKKVSSNIIRNYIENGKIESANEMLGRYFGFTLPVLEGNRIGRTLGTPTINQKMPHGFVLPRFGVYASNVIIDGKNYLGVTNVGVKPSIGKYDPLAETWIPDINMNLYGKSIKTELLGFIRDEKKFDNLESLKEEIIKNEKRARVIYKEIFK